MRLTFNTIALVIALGISCATDAGERIHRDRSQRDNFVRSHPCPATGSPKPHRACPGWEVDHIVALCAGGDDAPANMQWLSRADHKAKTRDDVRNCRALGTVHSRGD